MPRPVRLDVETKSDTKGLVAAAKSFLGLGKAMDKTSGESRELGRRMDATSRRVGELAREFARAGSEVERTRLDKAFRGEAAALARLKTIKRALDDLGDEADKTKRKLAQVGEGGGGMFAAGGLFGKAFASPVLPTAVGVGVASAPLLAGAASGAVVGGLGIGGVAAGLAAAFQDGTVKASAAALGHEIRDDFLVAGQAFADSALDSIDEVRDAWRSELGPEFKAITAASEKLLAPLTDSGLGFAKDVMPAIRHAIERAGPVVDAIDRGVREFGRASAFIFESMGDNSEAAADALADVLVNTAKIVAGLGFVIDKLTDLYGGFVTVREAAGQIGVEIGTWFGAGGDSKRLLKDIGEAGHRSFGGIADDSAAAAQKVREFNDAINAAFGKLSSLDDANIDFRLGQIELRKELAETREEVGRAGMAFDSASEAGLRNRDAIKQQVDAAIRLRDAEIDAANGTQAAVDKANAAFRGKVAAIRAVGVAAGLSGKDLDKFLERYLAIVRAPNATKKIFFVSDTSKYHPPKLAPGQYALFSSGGPVTGPRRGIDSVPALLAPGEFVLNRKMVAELGGLSTLEGMRTGAAQSSRRPSGYMSLPPARTTVGTPKLQISYAGSGNDLIDALMRSIRVRVISDGGGNVQLALGN